MTPPLKRVIMRAPGDSLRQAKAEDWHYGPGFDGNRAIEQFGIFADLVSASGTEIIWIEDSGDGLADAMFTHDPSLVTDKGAVILRMGKPGRMAEPDLHEVAYKAAGVPILGTDRSAWLRRGRRLRLGRRDHAGGRPRRSDQPGGHRAVWERSLLRSASAFSASTFRSETVPMPACT
jgi:dimethylargininase